MSTNFVAALAKAQATKPEAAAASGLSGLVAEFLEAKAAAKAAKAIETALAAIVRPKLEALRVSQCKAAGEWVSMAKLDGLSVVGSTRHSPFDPYELDELGHNVLEQLKEETGHDWEDYLKITEVVSITGLELPEVQAALMASPVLASRLVVTASATPTKEFSQRATYDAKAAARMRVLTDAGRSQRAASSLKASK
jgi:hypothetical protein